MRKELSTLNETSTTVAPTRKSNGGRPYPPMFPQWLLDIFRPVIWLLCRLLWRVRWVGIENIPASGSLIIAANHQTYIDAFWLSCPIKRPVRYLAWDAAFNWPLAGPFMRLLGAWPLQLEGSDPGPIRRSMQWLREGGAVVIFPEGGRGNTDGSMKKFKPGAVRMALETGAAILPVTIRGGHRVWPSSYRFPRLVPIEVIYHAPLVIEHCESEETRECARRETARLAAIVASGLSEPAIDGR